VECGNVCGSMIDSIFVDVVHVSALAWPDTIVCPGSEVRLHASGGVIYQWSPTTWLDDPSSAEPLCIPYEAVNYTITVVDDKGCSAQTVLEMDVFDPPDVDAGLDVFADWGVPIQLNGRGEGTYHWEPVELVDQPDVAAPFTSPEESTMFTLTITDHNGCRATDTVMVTLNGSMFIPNAFTPNGDGINDHFGAWGKDIVRFRMVVFDRWGGTIYDVDDMEQRWDGSCGGEECASGVYIWRIDMEERTGTRRTLYGHVNLLR
jgi:gliding motility-associated-like protein